jgi:hypothetical protein
MGGYQAVTNAVPEIVRGMDAYFIDNLNYLHLGGATQLNQFVVNTNGNLASTADRTPAGFSTDPDNLWQFSVFFEQVGATNHLIAHAAPNLSDIASSVATPIYFGQVDDTAVLTSTGKSVSGGAIALGPYLMAYGSDGLVSYSTINDPNGTYTDAWITPQKIVKGLPLRGSGAGPAGLFWSLDSLIRGQFVGGATVWAFDTLSAETSILSSQGVIEYDGIFYWLGIDRMLMFNGVIRDIPNSFNLNDFFDNLNYTHRQKVFAYKVPRFGEIWWCYPRGNATECTHAIIFNVNEGVWYDTALPDEDRTTGVYAKVYRKPFMVDRVDTGVGYTLWQHETGTDKIQQSDVQPIPSYFETAEISLLTQEQAQNKALHVALIEPDFKQSGNMTVTVRGRINSRAPQTDGETFTFSDVATSGDEETVKVKETKRLMSFKFASNTIGGHYEMGECLAHVAPADGRTQT